MASPLLLTGRPAVFLDRDGVLNENRSDYVKSWAEFTFLPGVFTALRRLARTGLAIVVVTNQSAINRGLVSAETVEEIHARMVAEIARRGGRVDAVFCCPHRPDENCPCRKPRPGLLLQAARELGLALPRSYLVGDALSDVELALSLGCTPFLTLTGRGLAQLSQPQVRQLQGFYVVADLREAVELITALAANPSGRHLRAALG